MKTKTLIYDVKKQGFIPEPTQKELTQYLQLESLIEESYIPFMLTKEGEILYWFPIIGEFVTLDKMKSFIEILTTYTDLKVSELKIKDKERYLYMFIPNKETFNKYYATIETSNEIEYLFIKMIENILSENFKYIANVLLIYKSFGELKFYNMDEDSREYRNKLYKIYLEYNKELTSHLSAYLLLINQKEKGKRLNK